MVWKLWILRLRGLHIRVVAGLAGTLCNWCLLDGPPSGNESSGPCQFPARQYRVGMFQSCDPEEGMGGSERRARVQATELLLHEIRCVRARRDLLGEPRWRNPTVLELLSYRGAMGEAVTSPWGLESTPALLSKRPRTRRNFPFGE